MTSRHYCIIVAVAITFFALSFASMKRSLRNVVHELPSLSTSYNEELNTVAQKEIEEDNIDENCLRPRPNSNAISKSPLQPPCKFQIMLTTHATIVRTQLSILHFYSHHECFCCTTLVINLGMPKMGSSSLHSYFQCGGFESVHWTCGGKGIHCGDCIERAIKAGRPPLSLQNCTDKKIDSYAQIDKGPFKLIQVNYLSEIVSGVPNATFILTFRNMTKWYMSLTNWYNRSQTLRKQFRRANITGLPKGVGNNVNDFRDFYCQYVKRVRKEVAQYRQHELVEIDIEDPMVGLQMEKMFGTNHTCWRKENVSRNKNPISEEELQ